MNISNALYLFTSDCTSAQDANFLQGVEIHADVYQEIKPGKTVRIDDLRMANPVPAANKTIRKDNAIVSVQFVAMPATQKLEDRLAARQLAEDMADEWLAKMFDNPSLSDAGGNKRICMIGQVQQFNDWIKPASVKMPVCVIRLQINPRK